jgi:hypothetical protein
LVCKTWNLFLVNERKLWMGILRQTRPYFELISKQLIEEEIKSFEAERLFFLIYCDFVEISNLEKSEDFCSQNIIKIFQRFQMIHIVLQDVIQDSPDYEVFQKEFIGEKLAGEVQLQIDKAEKEKQQDPKQGHFDFRKSFAWMFNQVTSVIECRQMIENVKKRKLDYDENIYEQLLLHRNEKEATSNWNRKYGTELLCRCLKTK